MKIGVISDTHIPISASRLPPKAIECFKDCDMIIHAGDAVELSVIKELERYAETKAVAGNMDSDEIRSHYPKKVIFSVMGKKIGVVHGAGSGVKTIQTVKKAFTRKLDIIIFGHSHAPFNQEIEGTLYFNPGSATDHIFTEKRSFGIIEILRDNISAKIINCDD